MNTDDIHKALDAAIAPMVDETEQAMVSANGFMAELAAKRGALQGQRAELLAGELSADVALECADLDAQAARINQASRIFDGLLSDCRADLVRLSDMSKYNTLRDVDKMLDRCTKAAANIESSRSPLYNALGDKHRIQQSLDIIDDKLNALLRDCKHRGIESQALTEACEALQREAYAAYSEYQLAPSAA